MARVPLTSTIATAIAILGAMSYPALLLFVLGVEFSPYSTATVWGLAAEHSELELEHCGHFMVALGSALPLAFTSKLPPQSVTLTLVLVAALTGALPYAMQPTHGFLANDGWLANYTWQVAAVEAALAPVLLVAALAFAAWPHRGAGKNAA